MTLLLERSLYQLAWSLALCALSENLRYFAFNSALTGILQRKGRKGYR